MGFVSPMLAGLGMFLLPLTATADEEATVVRMGTLPGLQYDLKQFDVRPGAEVKLVFRNDDTMLHNLVIVKPGTREEVVAAANALGGEAAEKDYIPDSANVLWSIGVVDQETSKTLEFKAPMESGDYPYVCTYPGHGLIMHGIMRVTENPEDPVKNFHLRSKNKRVGGFHRGFAHAAWFVGDGRWWAPGESTSRDYAIARPRWRRPRG